MTKLYEKQSYLKEYVSSIEDCRELNGNNIALIEDTIFFPEEGGQYADTGRLVIEKLPEDYNGNLNVGDSVELKDGQIVDGEIVYIISDFLPKGTLVRQLLNWEQRFDRMQNHSGEHVLTGTIHNKYGFNNVGFHLSDEGLVTLDIDGTLSYEQVLELEKEANEIIYKDVPIVDSYPTKEQLSDITYRSKIEIDGQVRLITVGDETETYDVCACCAPHVKTTGQIGIIKVISVINYKKGIQIGILCGRRALEYINKEQSALMSVSRLLSTSFDNVEQVVKSRGEEIASLKAKLSQAIEGKIINEISEIPEGEPGCIFTDEELTAANLKNVYNALCGRFEGFVGVFMGNDEAGYRYNAGNSKMDSRILANVLREKLGAKGGGSTEMIQGRVSATREEITEVFKNV